MLALRDRAKSKPAHFTNEEKVLACVRSVWTLEAFSSDLASEPALIVPKYALNDNNPVLPFSIQVTPAEVHKIVAALPLDKAGDIHGLHNRALRMLVSEDKEGPFETLLACRFTVCLEVGYFPTAWKTAVVSMVSKADEDRFDIASNWRPTVLLCLIGKILERIVADWLSAQQWRSRIRSLLLF
jgi:hypothetical protein